eukprot:XP_014048013.1 PREDICTED: tubulin polyglutamylase ttll6-like isoform X2 [Salmo salar]
MRPPEDVLDEETSPSSSCDSPGTNKAQGGQQGQEPNTPNVPPGVALIRKKRSSSTQSLSRTLAAFMHQTNYTINKQSENFVWDENAGSERKLSTLTRLLEMMRCDTGKLWADIEDVAIEALVSAHSVLRHSYHICFPHQATSYNATGAYFQILGFHVLINHRLKPWLIERGEGQAAV